MYNIILPLNNAGDVKKLFSSSLNSLFLPAMAANSLYKTGDIVNAIRNSITGRLYIETYVRNCQCQMNFTQKRQFKFFHFPLRSREAKCLGMRGLHEPL